LIKAVIFDLDNTVYNYDGCHKIAMQELRKYASVKYSITEDVFNEAFEAAKRDVKCLLGNTGASHNRMLYMQLFLEKIGQNPVDSALDLYDVYWNTMLSNMELFPYVIRLMQQLKEEGIIIGVLTDLTAHIQHRKIAKLGLIPYIDAIVTSEEAGEEKPSKVAFERIALKINCKSDEILMIGDSIKKDVEGAISMGMHGLLFVSDEKDRMNDKVMEYIHERMDK